MNGLKKHEGVSLFIPCLEDQFLPEIVVETAQLLKRQGAKTGVLAMIFSGKRERLTSLMPNIHVAILKAENLLPHTGALF